MHISASLSKTARGSPAGGEDVDLVEGVAERETLDGVGDVAVEHADAADGGVVRHAHLHSVAVTAAPPRAAAH